MENDIDIKNLANSLLYECQKKIVNYFKEYNIKLIYFGHSDIGEYLWRNNVKRPFVLIERESWAMPEMQYIAAVKIADDKIYIMTENGEEHSTDIDIYENQSVVFGNCTNNINEYISLTQIKHAESISLDLISLLPLLTSFIKSHLH